MHQHMGQVMLVFMFDYQMAFWRSTMKLAFVYSIPAIGNAYTPWHDSWFVDWNHLEWWWLRPHKWHAKQKSQALSFASQVAKNSAILPDPQFLAIPFFIVPAINRGNGKPSERMVLTSQDCCGFTSKWGIKTSQPEKPFSILSQLHGRPWLSWINKSHYKSYMKSTYFGVFWVVGLPPVIHF